MRTVFGGQIRHLGILIFCTRVVKTFQSEGVQMIPVFSIDDFCDQKKVWNMFSLLIWFVEFPENLE